MRRRLSVLLAVAMMVASSGMASAAPGNDGRGAEEANPNEAFGIATAIVKSGGGDCGLQCGG